MRGWPDLPLIRTGVEGPFRLLVQTRNPRQGSRNVEFRQEFRASVGRRRLLGLLLAVGVAAIGAGTAHAAHYRMLLCAGNNGSNSFQTATNTASPQNPGSIFSFENRCGPEHIRGDDLASVLWEQRHDLLAYAISFAVIGRFWVVHHRFFGDVVGFDGRLLGLNLLYLAWIVLIPFSSQVLGDHGGDTDAIVLYAVNLVGVSLIGALMAVDARRAGLAEPDPEAAREGHRRALIVAAVFSVSIPVAFIDPHVAQLVWLALFVYPVGRRVRRRRSG